MLGRLRSWWRRRTPQAPPEPIVRNLGSEEYWRSLAVPSWPLDEAEERERIAEVNRGRRAPTWLDERRRARGYHIPRGVRW